MGITIRSKNKSIDMGYGGFYNLRKTVAKLAADDIGKHYEHLMDAPYSNDERKSFFEDYDKKIEELSEIHNGEMDSVLIFIYQSDCEGSLSIKDCRKIYEIIKDYDDDVLYGYWGRPDCAKFADFKAIVKDCIDNRCKLKWY